MNILIIDDHPLIRISYKNIIQNICKDAIFFEYDKADSLESFLNKEKIEFAIVDLNLKEKSGFCVIKLLHSKQPNCKIIVISMYDDIEIVWLCKKFGASAFIPKNSELITITNILKKIFNEIKYSFITTQELHQKISSLLISDIEFFYENFSILSYTEKTIFKLKIHGYKNKEIASLLKIKLKTVENHITNITSKCIPHNYNFREFMEKYKTTLKFIASLE